VTYANRVLAVAPEPFFATRGTPFSVYYRALVMAEQGVRVDLLTYPAGRDVDLPGVRVIRVPGPGPLRRNIPVGPSWKKACLDVLMALWTLGLLIRRRYGVVHAHEEAVFWCRWLKPLFRFRLVYDMHSSLPQQLGNFEFSRSKLLRSIFQWAEDAALRGSDAIITICPDLADYVLQRGADPERHFLIENSIFDRVRLKGCEPNGSNGHSRNGDQGPAGHSREGAAAPNGNGDALELGTPDLSGEKHGPWIVYTGTFEPYQGIELLIRATPEVLAERADARLILVGGSAWQIRSMKELAEQQGVEHACRFPGTVPKDTARRYAENADVLVTPRRIGNNTPLKIYEWLASGIPIVATNIRAHTQVLDERVSVIVDPEPG
jgi:glycosyltransferase involved in cell wall biosynthesis